MIISLDNAKLIDPTITQEKLDGYEVAIREVSNNNFQRKQIRFSDLEFISTDSLKTSMPVKGVLVGDTLQVNDSIYNDGLYEVKTIVDKVITVKTTRPFELSKGGMATLVVYPPDVIMGIEKLIAYDKKMGSKIGIKSEAISRMSITYYDVNSAENIDGYPSSLLSFLKKYEKMRW